MDNTPKLTFVDVTKCFGKKCILEKISFSLPSGSVTAIIGKNGSGKTSLSNIISGFWSVTKGRRIVTGITPTRVNYLFQSTFLDVHLSIRSNLQIIALMQSAKIAVFISEVYERLHSIFEVNFPLDSKVKSLSQGQLRMLEFCISVTPDFDLLLLDEPTTHLDIQAKEKALAWLENMLLDCTGVVVMSTHDSDEFDLCDRYIYLADQRIKKSFFIEKQTYKKIITGEKKRGSIESEINFCCSSY